MLPSGLGLHLGPPLLALCQHYSESPRCVGVTDMTAKNVHTIRIMRFGARHFRANKEKINNNIHDMCYTDWPSPPMLSLSRHSASGSLFNPIVMCRTNPTVSLRKSQKHQCQTSFFAALAPAVQLLKYSRRPRAIHACLAIL